MKIRQSYPLGITAINKEQLSGTEAKISCTVTGLTRLLDKVRWTKDDGTDIKPGDADYNFTRGTFSGGSQTTILTVAASKNDLDTTYSCVITSNEHGGIEQSTNVHLKVFSKCPCKSRLL